MRLLTLLAVAALSLALVPAAEAGPNTFPVCKDKSATVPGVTAVYVNFDCYDGIYVCEPGQTARTCDRLVDLSPR